MPRWLYGGLIVIYLGGLFVFGLVHHLAQVEPNALDSIAFGARWPLFIWHSLTASQTG